MNKITIDLTKLVELAIAQVEGPVDHLLLARWLDSNIGAAHLVTVDLAAVAIKNQTETNLPILQARVNDVTTFGDESELHIHVLAPRGGGEDLATRAYYRLLAALSNL